MRRDLRCGLRSTLPLPAAPVPPEIEFAGVVSDVRTYADGVEFTDADAVVHTVREPQTYRDVGGSGWDGPLLILGRDADGPFVAGFMTQEGLPGDCYVQREAGIERGSHIEFGGILWRKAPSLGASIGFGEPYPPDTRFCLDAEGMIHRVIGRWSYDACITSGRMSLGLRRGAVTKRRRIRAIDSSVSPE